MVIQDAAIPEQSIIKHEEGLFDYIDSFQGAFTDKEQKIDLAKAIELFVSNSPKWADSLLKIRDKIVKPFGLKTADHTIDKEKQIKKIKYEVGEQVGIFELIDMTENEAILGQNDKHLSFKVSLLLTPIEADADKRRLSMTTAVKFNNIFGKLYFLPVKPIHRIIVRKSVENIIKKIELKGTNDTLL